MKFFTQFFLLCTTLCTTLCAALCACADVCAMTVGALSCEMASNPLCVERESLRLSWQLSSDVLGDGQTAYRIIVASSRAHLDKNHGDMWDSREQRSSQSQLLPYAGRTLERGERYHWKVMAWDAAGRTTAWSSAATFDIAPLINTINVRWIGAIKRSESALPQGRGYNPPFKKFGYDTLFAAVDTLAKRSILLRKNFSLDKRVRRAMAYVSGLGHYEFSVNGRRVGKSVFAPLWSDYDKTIYYNAYDLTALLLSGRNALGVALGNGFYNASENSRYRKLMLSFGPPTLFFSLRVDYVDGSSDIIASDKTWRYAPSPITFNSIYGGESYDAQLEQPGWDTPDFDDASWLDAVVQESPKGRLRPQLAPPVEVMESFGVRRVIRPKPNTYVLDMGQNLAGFPTIRVQGQRGQTLRLYPAESLTADSLVNQQRSGSPYYFEYTLRGEGVEEWTPRFAYYGYRYLQVDEADYGSSVATNDSTRPTLLDVRSNFIRCNVDEVGEFECSNEIFNGAHRLISNAVKSNMQAVFTDCPHREKLGWLEQLHLNGPGLMYSFNLAQLMPKLARDMIDAQWSNGMVPSIAPEYTTFRDYMDFSDSPEWGVAVVVMPWMYYQFYGDSTLIARCFGAMRRYVGYLASRAEGHVVSHGLGDWYDYGTHPAGYAKNTPIALSATAHYYAAVALTARAAALLGREDLATHYATQAENIRWAFNTKFFDPDTKQYGSGSQASNAMPLYMGMVQPLHRQAVLHNLIADIQAHGNRLTTGDVGNRYLFQTLAQNGYNDVMFALHNHRDAPGYGYQLGFDITTLTEQWDPARGNSWNHFMLGQIEEWFYRSLAGIAPDSAAPGFAHFTVAPVPVGDLSYVKASYASRYGNIGVHWTSADGRFILRLTVPVNTTATVTLPYAEHADILLNHAPIAASQHAKKLDEGRYLVGSGEYEFEYGEN
ncbi:MAG: glycoside hydrolase family 78 protein [Prevotellaceae bacterium]|jgi:hypothetical protein|nr:glycoside hydrolase family 78 protein [Prevotellaceae bacterium]